MSNIGLNVSRPRPEGGLGLEQGDVEHEIVRQDILRDAELGWHRTRRRLFPTLAVAAIVHLHRWRVDMPAADRDAAGETGYAASALFPQRETGRVEAVHHPERLSISYQNGIWVLWVI